MTSAADTQSMKIGKFVREYLPMILDYCEANPAEYQALLTLDYSKEAMGLGYPFFLPVEGAGTSDRYWAATHEVLDGEVRVTSEWFKRHRVPFIDYLIALDLIDPEQGGALKAEVVIAEALAKKKTKTKTSIGAVIKKSNPIGNVQNLLVRTILSRSGATPTMTQWQQTIEYFDGRCAYCDEPTPIAKLEYEHVRPINKTALGDNRIGNLVPSCNQCNKDKGGKDYRTYLRSSHRVHAETRIQRIDDHAARQRYLPLKHHPEFRQIQAILERARQEAKAAADEAVAAIDCLLQTPSP